MFNLLKGDVLSDWAIDHRYSGTGKITDRQVSTWFGTTKRLLAAAGIRVREL